MVLYPSVYINLINLKLQGSGILNLCHMLTCADPMGGGGDRGSGHPPPPHKKITKYRVS